MRIVVTGLTGTLSKELQKLDSTITGLRHDIIIPEIINALEVLNPDVVIHAAAATDSEEAKTNPIKYIKTNIVGTANIAEYCILNKKRLVYISTDYVYPGIRGSYNEEDSLKPYNDYAWTKLGGECAVRLVPNSLIIRTSFGPSEFKHKEAYDNYIVSKDYVDIIAPKILKAAVSDLSGVLNIGTEAKSIYDYASLRNVVKKGQGIEVRNFSLNTNKYEQLFGDI